MLTKPYTARSKIFQRLTLLWLGSALSNQEIAKFLIQSLRAQISEDWRSVLSVPKARGPALFVMHKCT